MGLKSPNWFKYLLIIPGAFCIQNGCQEGIVFDAVHFNEFTIEIDPADSASLFKNLEILENNTDLYVELAGHTNSTGSDSENLVLSQARAETIRAWLVAKNIDSLRLAARGYGEDYPVADNRTAEGRAENDRVNFLMP